MSIQNLSVAYKEKTAVRNVSLEVGDHEIVALVGESGCGKSTLLKTVLNLEPAARVTGGRILFEGRDLLSVSGEELRRIRGNDISMVFQQATASMDPMKTIGHLCYETVRMHRDRADRRECGREAVKLMERMRLADGERILRSYPFQLSGGMCQRAAIAAAMMNRPRLLLADEPTSALDVTAQAQVVELMKRIREEFGTSFLVVTHNIGAAAHLADRLAVMFRGRIVEEGPAREVLDAPFHDYTKMLLTAVPKMPQAVSDKGIEGQ